MIYFVGAGSGAADLITVRGARLLENADVVVWAGSLVNKELLSYCKSECEIYDSAKMTLEETDAILQKAAREGKICVRLHTGDPSIFGAIREQMALLDAADISYEVVPGVSSMFAAASSLKRELTVPEISQTVIISRMEGRTPVPEREKIRFLAEHGATMVLFLSSGMLPELTAELLSGGAYTERTPCAVVYKASWQDEKIVRGTLADIAGKTAEAGITKTALVLVGDFLGDRYELSRLYDKQFSTKYRKGNLCVEELTVDYVAIVCFTERGAKLAERIALSFPNLSHLFRCFGEGHLPLEKFCEEQFSCAHGGKRVLLVFVGAAGIAVRAVSPFVKSKAEDPAVVCADESGRFVISLLSGHLGGANDAAKAIASVLGAIPVVTTATDGRGTWAIDNWAKKHGWHIPDLATAKKITAAVLAKKKPLCVGIGCKQGTDSHVLSEFVRAIFSEYDLDLHLVGAVASICLKKDEKAVCDFASELGVPFITFTADELNTADAGTSSFSSSDFVRETTGVDCVCERAAVLAGNTTADWLLLRKTARNGMTIAASISPIAYSSFLRYTN
ncbi:MAG: precorrin-4 C(11)-methyltransferase [Treponema sp.]|nr:precorrin-4 C(11)-methyltransferase [Treponema sp.]